MDNNEDIELEYIEIADHNIIEVSVGTTCPTNSNSGHGGKTIFRIEDMANTDIKVNVLKGNHGSDEGVEIVLNGDSECETFIRALEFATKVLKEQYQKNNRLHRDTKYRYLQKIEDYKKISSNIKVEGESFQCEKCDSKVFHIEDDYDKEHDVWTCSGCHCKYKGVK